jgi:tetratricopeptide (TPR) repeat protein
LEAVSPAAAALLHLCAFLAPEDIPLDLFPEGAEFFPESLAGTATDPIALHDAVAAARRLSLLEVEDEAISLHRLVQAAVRDRCNKRKRSSGPPPPRVACGPIAYGDLHPEVATAANNIGHILGEQGDMEGALKYTWRALEIDEAAYGSQHPKIAIRANNIGTILQEQGKFAEAKKFLLRAVAVARMNYGEDHPYSKGAAANLPLSKDSSSNSHRLLAAPRPDPSYLRMTVGKVTASHGSEDRRTDFGSEGYRMAVGDGVPGRQRLSRSVDDLQGTMGVPRIRSQWA